MADTNNLHTADSLTAVTVTAVMVVKAMVLRSCLTHLDMELPSSSTERLATMALVDKSIIKPTPETSAFPRPVRASNPSTRDTDRLLSLPLAVDMVPDLVMAAMAATEDTLATVLVAAMVATMANATSTATMSARRLATAVSLVTAMAPTKMWVVLSTKIDATTLTLPATSTEGTPLKAETAEESTKTGVMTQTKLERDQTDTALTKIADTTVTAPQTNLNKEVFLAINDKLLSPEGQGLLSPAVVPHQSQCSLPLMTADLATAMKKSLKMRRSKRKRSKMNYLECH